MTGGMSSAAAASTAGGVSPLPLEEVQALAAQVVAGLHALHEKVGYLHVVVKLANVLWSGSFRHVVRETLVGRPGLISG